jgi:DNA polymerase-1
LLEVPKSDLNETAVIVRDEMQNAVKLDVPLTVDVKSGADWESMTPLALD